MNTLLTVNMLVIGGGRSGRRFVESYLFDPNINITIAGFSFKNESIKLAKKYCLEHVEFSKISDFSMYDVLVLSVPYNLKKLCMKTISENKYHGRIILEKPFATNKKDYYTMMNMLENNYFSVAFSRRYEKLYDLSIGEKNRILWPLRDYDNVDIYYDLLPHCIDWIVRGLNKDIEEINVTYKTKYKYEFWLDEKHFVLDFVNDESDKVEVNGKRYPWIDIYKINNILLRKLLNQNKKDLDLEKELYYISIIMEVLKEQ